MCVYVTNKNKQKNRKKTKKNTTKQNPQTHTTKKHPSTPRLQMQACGNWQLPIDTDDMKYQCLSIATLEHSQCHKKGWGSGMNSPSMRSEFMLH